MSGRVVLVTGAASGIGATLAKTLATEDGCCLLLHTRASVESLKAVGAQCRDSGAVVETVLGDLAEVGAAKSLVDACIEKFGRLDCIVANAGHADSTALEEIDAAAFQLMFSTMAQSFLELAQSALPFLRQSAAPRVVAISSFIAHRYEEGALFVSSAAAKAALESIVRTLARVVAPDRIPVNIVAPGHVEKDKMIGTAAAAARRKSVAARVPMQRIATPADIVPSIMFLLSEGASYITGEIIRVDGGLATL